MFYLYAIGSMLGYALQNALLAQHARKMDGLSLAFYRNISFTFTLLPLLIGTSVAEISIVLSHWVLLLMAGIMGGLYLGTFYMSYRYLPVGIAGALSRAFMTVLLTIVGWVFLGDRLSPAALAIILIIIAGSLLLGLTKNAHAHLRDHLFLGIALTVLAAIFLTATNYTPAVLSRIANPLVSGYFWELSIAIGSGILLLLRWMTIRVPMALIDARTFLSIALCSLPTLIGTGLFTLATRMGPVAIVTAIGSAQLVLLSFLGVRLYREHLKTVQWFAISLILAGVIGLKFV